MTAVRVRETEPPPGLGAPLRLARSAWARNPTKPKTRNLATGDDAVRLLQRLYRNGAGRAFGPRVHAPRKITAQNCHRDRHAFIAGQTPPWNSRAGAR
ncbi:hypothetical protein [Streptomyces hydrogenans]|uniref:hypothetical protein n=1 Tax=Streptomyces hydrogenans TaxID=1873719 RepID=UPI0036EB0B64